MKIYLIVVIATLLSCVGKNTESPSQECLSYDCRSKEIIIYADPIKVRLNETSTLFVRRNKFFLPHFRVIIADFDSLYNVPDGQELSSFEGTDSIASLVLEFETAGLKKIRGVVEEYNTNSEIVGDSSNTYLYPFEIELEVVE
ncbi:MAG: hypothetical protein AAF600_21165 [Bacteroidota bacterium]